MGYNKLETQEMLRRAYDDDNKAITTTINPTSTLGAILLSLQNGNGYAVTPNDTNTFNSTSDINYKKDIRKIENSLEKVMNLNGYHFTYKHTNMKSIGLIAQELEVVLPDVVETVNNVKTVSYCNIIALLIEALKEQQKQIESLKKVK
jgi:hypothetical protein